MPYIGKEPKTITTISDLTATGTTALTGNATAAGTLDVTGAITSSAGATITTADNTAQLTLKSTDADAVVGPVLDLVRDSSSPADDDKVGVVSFKGDDDAGNSVTFAQVRTVLKDVTDTAEDGELQLQVRRADSLVTGMFIGQTEAVFNEDGQNVDFRVESDNNANMLFVDASADAVGVGTNSPTLDSSLAGLSVSSDSTLLHINDSDGACLKLSDPASGSNRGLGIALQGTSAAISNCESGELRFGTGNTERMRITSAGAIGINESSPSTFLHIDNGGSNGSGQADAIRIHNPGTTAGDGAGIKFSAGSSTTGAAIFGIGQASNSCNLVFRSGGDSERMRLNSSGQLRLGDVFTGTFPGSDQQTLMVTGSVGIKGDSTCIRFYSDIAEAQVGSIQLNTTATVYNTTSDYRVKESVVNMSGAIDRVKQLAPKRFNFISDPDDTTVDGFLAHEVQTVVPEAISGTRDAVKVWTEQEIDNGFAPDGTSAGDNKLDADGNTIPELQGIDHSKLVPLLTAALKESIAKIESLEARVATLEG